MSRRRRNDYRAAGRRMLSICRRAEAEHSLRVFAELYLAAYFTLPPSPMHLELIELLESLVERRNQRIAIAAPREHAKSTLVTLAYVLWCLCYGKEPCIFIISDTAEQAVDHLSHIKHELENNDLLLEDFAEVCKAPGDRHDARRWRKAEIITGNDVKVVAFGADQKIRGRRHRQHRPTLILGDDLENDQQVRSADQRRFLRDWFNKTVLKAGGPTTNVVLIGTILHFDSLLARLTDRHLSPAWTGYRFQAIRSWSEHEDLWEKWEAIYNWLQVLDGRTGPEAALAFFEAHEQQMLAGTDVLWPKRDPYYRLMVTRREGRASFDSEKQNVPVNPEDCTFEESDFHFVDDQFSSAHDLLASFRGRVAIYGACDPSMGKKRRDSDFTAIITLAVDRKTQIRYVIDADIRRLKPDQIIAAIVEKQTQFHYTRFAMEAVQYQEFLGTELKKRSYARGAPVPVRAVRPVSDKRGRIESLQPHIRAGMIRFFRRQVQLLDQLRQHPMAAHDDGPDALEMVFKISFAPVRRLRTAEWVDLGGGLRCLRIKRDR